MEKFSDSCPYRHMESKKDYSDFYIDYFLSLV